MHHNNTMTIAGLAGLAAGVLTSAAVAQSTQVIFYEGFEGAVLEDSVGESTGSVTSPYPGVWTNTPPAGWTVDNSGVPFFDDPDQGIEEWKGWSFATIDFWATVGGSTRGSFADVATGTVAIADGDEWEDQGDPDQGDTNPMVTLLSTPALNVSADAGSTVSLRFASTWRPEEPQIAAIDVSFDGGAPTRILEWTWDDSQPEVGAAGSGNQTGYKAEHFENQDIDISVPAGASTMVVTYYYSGVNDYWWAIDNVEVSGNGGTYLSEDFEGLTLGDSIDELLGAPDPMVWTDELAGWTFDDSGFDPATLADVNIGVEEWEGFAVANGDWWQDVAGDQNRSNFTVDAGALSDGNLLVADPDEWDDLGSPSPEGDEYNASVTSPAISLAGVAEDTAELIFYSSWRPEDVQNAVVSVSFDGGDYTEILNWTSNGADPEVGPNGSGNQFGFKPDAENEVVRLPIGNPAGASSVQVRFAMPTAGNDWWWAIDDVIVTGETSGVATNAPAPFFIDIPSHTPGLNPVLSYGIGLEGTDVPADAIVAGAEEFVVTVAKDAGFTDVRYQETTATGPFTFPQGALQSGLYYVKVAATNSAGTRESSNTARFAVSNNCTNADQNDDGILDLTDISMFVTGFQAPCD